MKLHVGEVDGSVLATVTKYVPLHDGEALLFLVDDTFFGSAKSGWLMTSQRLVAFDRRDTVELSIGDIESFALEYVPNVGAIELTVSVANGDPIKKHVPGMSHERFKQLQEALHGVLTDDVLIVVAGQGTQEAHDAAMAARRYYQPAVGMVLTTTAEVAGKNITAYHGIVSAERVLGVSLFRDFEAGVADILGGRSLSYEKELCAGREATFAALEEAARDCGANAIVGLRLDYESVGKSMLMVLATGTAVSIS